MNIGNLIEKPIIFIGMGRSGTTIVSEIIFQHEDLAWPSNYQNKYPNRIWINKIRPLFDSKVVRLQGRKPQLNKVPFYNSLLFKPAEAYRFWNFITRDEINFSRDFLVNKKATSVERDHVRHVFEKLVRYQKRKRLAFKITGPPRIGYLSSIFPDAIFIEITREPFANIRSLLKVPFWIDRGMKQLWWYGAYSKDEEKLARDWKDRPALLTALQYKKVRDISVSEVRANQVSYFTIQYEKFISNPKVVVNEILARVGLNQSKYVEKYLQENKIYNRNTNAADYFNEEEVKEISLLLNLHSGY